MGSERILQLEREEPLIVGRKTQEQVQLKGSEARRTRPQRAVIDKKLLVGPKQREYLRPAFIRSWVPEMNLCLFTIIVAFEWTPNYNDLRLLREATTSASDLLYDVTDGFMAIGRICVGGQELMPCADIQIFASNRLFPRSTVDGLNDPEKYQPIRLGRGLWHKNTRITLPWDSEIGFTTLVHEWGHYALGLKDQYLEILQDKHVVVPVHNPVVDTIMAGWGKTELLGTQGPDSEWEALRTHPAFEWLNIPENHSKKPQQEPPERQPRPAFSLIGQTRQEAEQGGKHEVPHPVLRWDQFKDEMSAEHCWVYLLQTDLLQGDSSESMTLIAQGELESMGVLVDHTIDGPALQLLGAMDGDNLVLVGHSKDDPLKQVVLYSTITSFDNRQVVLNGWNSATLSEIPLLAVNATPTRLDPSKYILTLSGSNLDNTSAFLFPLDRQEGRQWDFEAGTDVDALDGHVMLLKEENGKRGLAIVSYSLGGSPDSGFPVHPNPIPAGSSDGNAMIFFYKPSRNHDQSQGLQELLNYEDMNRNRYAKTISRHWQQNGTNASTSQSTKDGPDPESYRIVVTTNYQAQQSWRNDWQPCSYTFGVTTHQPLTPLEKFYPTLVLYYDKDYNIPQQPGNQAKLVIARYDKTKSDRWALIEPVSLDDPKYKYIAAIPLNSTTAPGLFPADGQPKPEYFRLFLITE